MRSWIRSPDSIVVDMTEYTCRIGCLDIMTGSTRFDVSACLLSMKPSTGPYSQGREIRPGMAVRLEDTLIDVPACSVAGSAEFLRRVTGLTFRRLLLCKNSMREPETGVMHLKLVLPLTAAYAEQARSIGHLKV